ncbi:Autolytic lysozime (1,4-beta-N-acetylmuramidase), family 25 of glycosyl hydrolase; peptodoglycan-binding domain [Clostridium tyrobutyricum DIVETGP]|uniref:Autolytic lysozime (1,4-beta-N-acetylmuramidase), family 25 of glycosyl hydrolase peptodoglycan-binding domain n=2 Tax=Clostridium tyrobutyricum TaxID=1519 RepID=W6NGR5_CLOTY|nr:autolysin-like protein [Clostridium tyrobutyricum]QCH29049.1 Autolytic lysozyme [Clostridium tyrobutyricum]CDL91237.1 Autolytic lysozime (1,4-beta-N-acetylmuramidase), family 25 of glycosyl hydrolase; peptodoglycan-binding domain [Clostridium tyrobutyricum DIVETGP]
MIMKGIDIYSETVITDWTSVKNSGYEAVMIKATEGINYVNPLINKQYKNAKNLKLKIGFYHFARKNNPLEEYTHFIDIINNYTQELRPALDYEIGNNPDFNFINQFMSINSNLILYTTHNIGDNSGIAASRIWMAEPNTNPKDTKNYAGIQYNWNGNVSGIQGNVDMDLFSDSFLLKDNTPVSTIKVIQQELNLVLKSNLLIDGIKGNLTIKAINKFKSIMGLVQDGIWDNKSIQAITEIYLQPLDCIKAPHHEFATRYIQFRVGRGKDNLGIFSTGTAKCLSIWQSKYSLSADGKCGPLTWDKLLNKNC